MRILYVILAHNEPDALFEMASTLCSASPDSDVIIHFDAGANVVDTKKINQLVTGTTRVTLVDGPLKCRWGTFSLVEATLRALEQAYTSSKVYDYVVLLSGACRPYRPIVDFQRFLTDNNGAEFIEINDADWITDGLRNERYQFSFPFGVSKNYNEYERRWVQLQKILRIKRKVPNDIEVKFGSQWWALTWNTCVIIHKHLKVNPRITRFFKTTYIPDEMFFQSLVNQLVDKKKLAGKNLTFYKFGSNGKPQVFYNDSDIWNLTVDKFFFRKISPDARLLHARSMASATGLEQNLNDENDAVVVSRVLSQSSDQAVGEIFRRDQFSDQASSVLAKNNKPYVFIMGSKTQFQTMIFDANNAYFHNLGRILSKNEVFEDSSFLEFKGLNKRDLAIRDLHPALYLCRALSRSEKVPVIFWCPDDHGAIISEILQDKNALKVSLFGSDSKKSSAFSGINDCIYIYDKGELTVGNEKSNLFSRYEWFYPLINMLKAKHLVL